MSFPLRCCRIIWTIPARVLYLHRRVIEVRQLKLTIRLVFLITILDIRPDSCKENLAFEELAYKKGLSYPSSTIDGYEFGLVRIIYAVEGFNLRFSSGY